MTTLKMNLQERSYSITVGKGLIDKANEYFNLERKVFILTDSGVPKEYAERVAKLSKNAIIYTVECGEASKSYKVLEEVHEAMLDFEMTRSDAVVAVGGGVVGDLAGFAASTYMRGIDFYNLPTTLLAQVDSSIGGKTAINLGSVKNIIGAFHQPRGVLIDIDTLKTLPKRQINAGLAEAVKMAMTSDIELFSIFENEVIGENNIEKIITRSLMIKKSVVECDEKEGGLRKILNFGHTFGHAIEAEEGLGGLYHGECVALGMLTMCSESARERLLPVLKSLSLPTEYKGDIESALKFAIHDKKCKGGYVEAIFVEEIGSFKIQKMTIADFSESIRNALK